MRRKRLDHIPVITSSRMLIGLLRDKDLLKAIV